MSIRALASYLALSLALAACSGSHSPSRVAATRTTTALASPTSTAAATMISTTIAPTTPAPTATSLAAAEIVQCAFSHPAPSYRIWVMRMNGTGQRLLAPDVLAAAHPSWAPDSRQVVFAAFQDNRNALFIVDVDAVDGAPRRLTDAPTSTDHDPFWSPRGDWIVFSRNDAYDSSIDDIYVVRPDGSETRQLTTSGAAGRLAGWLPDGRVAMSQGELGELVALSVDDPGAAPTPLDGSELVSTLMSPDGEWTLFERGDDIFRMHPDGTAIRDLTDRVGEDTRPRWAPDGAHIVYESTVTALDATTTQPDRLGEPLPITLRVGDATQQGRVGPYCVATSSSAMGDDLLGVRFPAEPLPAPVGEPLVFKPWLNDANALTIVAYSYAGALDVAAIVHGALFRPCAPLGATQDTCAVATTHSFTADLGLPPGQYIIVVSLTWQRGAEQGYSEQGFNVEVIA